MRTRNTLASARISRRHAFAATRRCAQLAAAFLLGTWLGLSLPGNAAAKVKDVGKPPTALEMLRLPQYCLWQFNRDKPEFQAPQFRVRDVFPNCGVGTNHYCPGILALVRANRPGAPRDHRSYWTTVAQNEFQYTARQIQPYPSCGLHDPLKVHFKQLEVMSKKP